jgi:hypothetical protein
MYVVIPFNKKVFLMVKRKFIYENKNMEKVILDVLREEILGLDKTKHKITIRTRIGIIRIIPEMNRFSLWSKTGLEELVNKLKGLSMKEIEHEGPKGIKFK